MKFIAGNDRGQLTFFSLVEVSDCGKMNVTWSRFSLSARLPRVDFTGVCGGTFVFLARMRITDFWRKAKC
jgi:hypothetical protein